MTEPRPRWGGSSYSFHDVGMPSKKTADELAADDTDD